MSLRHAMKLIAACLLLLSCNLHKGADQLADSTVISKVRLYKGSFTIQHKDTVSFLRNFAQNLDLPILIGGFQGLYIRIWAWDFGADRYVIDIKKTISGNSCSIISFAVKKKDSSMYIFIHEKKSLVPQSGWVAFFDSLGKYNVPEMKTATLSTEQKGRLTSMEYIQFEIDQPDQYRFFEYLDPFIFRNEDAASQKVYSFLKYFNREMGTHIYNVEKGGAKAEDP